MYGDIRTDGQCKKPKTDPSKRVQDAPIKRSCGEGRFVLSETNIVEPACGKIEALRSAEKRKTRKNERHFFVIRKQHMAEREYKTKTNDIDEERQCD